MQKHVNLVDLVKSFPTNIFLQNLASIQKRTSPIKFAHLAEKSENGSISNLSTKLPAVPRRTRGCLDSFWCNNTDRRPSHDGMQSGAQRAERAKLEPLDNTLARVIEK